MADPTHSPDGASGYAPFRQLDPDGRETAAQHAAWARGWIRGSRAAVGYGDKTEEEHARTVAAVLEEALIFLERLGAVAPDEEALRRA